MIKRIGIMGGTFDPIHLGHLHVAEEVRNRFELDSIWLMVANSPPHKGGRPTSDPWHRYAMSVVATLPNHSLLACPLELSRPGFSYTIDTLDRLRTDFPSLELFFVAGADSLCEIHLWKDYARLFEEYALIFIERPGVIVDLRGLNLEAKLRRRVERVFSEVPACPVSGQAVLVNVGAPDISSSQVRGRIAQGEVPPAEMLPPAVIRYIQKYQLYGKRP